jgi:hypothetical protein
MKMNEEEYIKNEVKGFTKTMNEAYEKDNLIKDFCIIKEITDETKEFVQVGERINIPKDFFTEERGVSKDNTVIAEDFIRSLVNGEKDFVLKEIIKSEKIRNFTIQEFDYTKLCEIIKNLKNPTMIFFPLEPFFKELNRLYYESKDKAKFISGIGPVLIVEGKEIKIEWITSREKIDKIIVVNKEELEIIQKKYDNSETPKWMKIIEEYEEFNKGRKLITHFGNKDDKNFDFVFRTIISKPELNENSAITIDFTAQFQAQNTSHTQTAPL